MFRYFRIRVLPKHITKYKQPGKNEQIALCRPLHSEKTKKNLISLKSDFIAPTKFHSSLASTQKDVFTDSNQMHWHFYRVKKNLYPYLSVCVNSNQKDIAYNSLIYYHKTYQKYGLPLDDIEFYNCVLEGFAAEGNWKVCKDILKLISDVELKPNLQTFVYAIECACRAQKLDAVNEILQETKDNGFDINNVNVECNFVRDGKEVVLKAIRSVNPDFEPVKRRYGKNYSFKMLESLNKNVSEDRFYEPLGLNFESGMWTRFIEEQMEEDVRGFRKIKIFNAGGKKEKTKLRRILEDSSLKWKRNMLFAFERHVAELRRDVLRSNNVSNLFPYFSCLKSEEFVDIMFDEFLTFISNHNTIELLSIHKAMGYKVMNKYLTNKKVKNGVFNQTKKIYNEYCEYFTKPKISSKFTNRQYWEFLLEKYSDGPDITQLEPKWPLQVLIRLGAEMFSIMNRVIKLDLNLLENVANKQKNSESPFYFEYLYDKLDNKTTEVTLNSNLRVYLENLIDHDFVTLNIVDVPMISPPVPWNSVFSGGSITNKGFSYQSFLRSTSPIHYQQLTEMNFEDLHPCFDSLNQLSECPWKINKKLLNIVIELYKNWIDDSSEINLTKEEMNKILFGKRAKRSHSVTITQELQRELSIANSLKENIFWIPHNIDVCGRTHPMPQLFNYHMSDLQRGLLLFANEQPLGEEGLDWLQIHLHNLTGPKLRLTYKQRIDSCNELLPDIMDSADNPLKGKGWWLKSDYPLQTLACCIELTCALRSPDPSTYTTSFPVHQDGSCNAVQHLAALVRDPQAARLVNLEANIVPQDFYSIVTDKIEQERIKDAELGNVAAQFSAGLIDRQLIKLPLLLYAFGRSSATSLDYFELKFKDISVLSDDQKKIVADYILEKLRSIAREYFPNIRGVRHWFSDCATLISNIYEQPVEWLSPIGLPLNLPYSQVGHVLKRKRNKSSSECEIATKESNARKQARSFTANYVRSLESSHMMLTSLHCQREGITFVSVHDNFWTHPNTVSQMNKIIREQFVALHSEPRLELLAKQLRERFCVENPEIIHGERGEDLIRLKQLLTQIPAKGDFDLKNVLQANYLFS